MVEITEPGKATAGVSGQLSARFSLHKGVAAAGSSEESVEKEEVGSQGGLCYSARV